MHIRFARHGDLPAVRALLEACGLPDEDIDMHLATLLVGEQARQIVASGAIEPLGCDCLLRSVAIVPVARGRGWGLRMSGSLLDFARDLRMDRVWLLTTTAAGFFARQGFTAADRATAPPAVCATRQFGALCPATASLMRLQLEERS